MRKGQKDVQGSVPFYAPSGKYKTSAEIIREARAHIHPNAEASSSSGSHGAPRPLPTQRPFTPKDRQRILFGKAGKPSRPPSAVSLRYLQQQSTDSLMSSMPSVKRVQLSPMPPAFSSSLDESAFNRLLLDNIDEKPELLAGERRRKQNRTKSLQLELEQDSDVSKFKLPCLNGLAKPLHQRKSPGQIKSPFSLQSLSEEHEESGFPTSSSLSRSTKSLQGSKDELENQPTPAISLDIFNKRRLFSDFKSKSDDTKLDLQYRFDDLHEVQSSIGEKSGSDSSRKSSVVDFREKTGDLEAKSSNRGTPMKIALQIPTTQQNSVIVSQLYTEDTIQTREVPVLNITQRIKESKVLLDKLNSGNSKTCSEDEIVSDMKQLYAALEKEGSWQRIERDEKAHLLKTLYKYVESSNEKLLMAIARIVLSIRVSGSNLSGICKLIFKVARNDKNDYLFFADNTLDLFMVGLGSAEPLNDAECLVYGYGALKFLGMSPALLERMKPIGALQLMTLHLKMFNQARSDNPQAVAEQGCHALYQLTGALRNMAGHSDITPPSRDGPNITETAALQEFISCGAMTELCKTLRLFPDDLDIETNVSRTLSVLSADYECCEALCEERGILSSIIRLLEKYTEKSPLVVRLNYILGNMVACSDVMRLELYEEGGAMDILMKILDVYMKHTCPTAEYDTAENIIIGSDLDGSSGSDEDVMVKTVRVLANMCMNPVVGSALAAGPRTGRRLIQWLVSCLSTPRINYHQNQSNNNNNNGSNNNAQQMLMTSVLATLNNLTYYHTHQTGAMNKLEIELCRVLCNLLTLDIPSCVTEATRVLGNLSRSQTTRDYIVDSGALENVTNLINSEDEDTCLSAAGVLVNMAADPSARDIWVNKLGGVQAAITSLRMAASYHQWTHAQLLCQALWNATPLDEVSTAMLSPLLLNMLDEHQVFGNADQINRTLNSENKSEMDELVSAHMSWEEFASVAVNLLEKIDPTLDSPLNEEDGFMFTKTNRTMSESDLSNM